MKQGLWVEAAVTFTLSLFAVHASAQQLIDISATEPGAIAAGWQGFTDVSFLLNAFFTLSLSALLGALIGYHPRNREAADTLLELELPNVYILFSVIGAIIGILVVKYGMVVGFVIFGIGGLLRFRTILDSADLTGNVIFVTLIGLSCGLNLPHVAVLATIFCFVLVYLFHVSRTFSVHINGINAATMPEASSAYRALLEQKGCRIIRERKKPTKCELSLIFRCPRSVTREQLEHLMESGISPPLKGTIDWRPE